MSTIRISGKNLGQLNSPDTCPLCFQTLSRIGFSHPYNIFPGIFSTFDSLQKKLVRGHLEDHGKLPPWMKKFHDGASIHKTPYKLQFHDPETDILLVGIPDEVFVKKDGSLLLVDYKTGKYTGNQDALLPMYSGQLNSYAWLLDKLGLGSVTTAGLIYFEPTVTHAGATIEECFSVGFKATEVAVDMEPDKVPKLLALARAVCDMTPAPKAKEGCRDCDLLGTLLAIHQSQLAVGDAQLKSMDFMEKTMYIAKRDYDFLSKSIAVLKDGFQGLTPPESKSLIREWDWS